MPERVMIEGVVVMVRGGAVEICSSRLDMW
jgi:hypothetical protein